MRSESVLATALSLFAFGFGSLVSGPLPETVGRNPVYIASLLIFMVWVMASRLAPNIAAQLMFRFRAGFFGCTPFTTFGGGTCDIWTLLDRTDVFPMMACLPFLGPFLAPILGACKFRFQVEYEQATVLIFGLPVTGQSSVIKVSFAARHDSRCNKPCVQNYRRRLDSHDIELPGVSLHTSALCILPLGSRRARQERTSERAMLSTENRSGQTRTVTTPSDRHTWASSHAGLDDNVNASPGDGVDGVNARCKRGLWISRGLAALFIDC